MRPYFMILCIGWCLFILLIFNILYQLSIRLGVLQPIEILRASNPPMALLEGIFLGWVLISLLHTGILLIDHILGDEKK